MPPTLGGQNIPTLRTHTKTIHPHRGLCFLLLTEIAAFSAFPKSCAISATNPTDNDFATPAPTPCRFGS